MSTQIQNYVFRRAQLLAEQDSHDPKDNFFIEEFSKFTGEFLKSSYMIKTNYDGNMYSIKKADFFKVLKGFNSSYLDQFLQRNIKTERRLLTSIHATRRDNEELIGQKELINFYFSNLTENYKKMVKSKLALKNIQFLTELDSLEKYIR